MLKVKNKHKSYVVYGRNVLIENKTQNENRIIILGDETDLQSIPNLKKANIVITFELAKEKFLKEKNIPAIYFHRYAQSTDVWESIVSTSKRWLETWPKIPIYQGLSALEIFKYEDTSLWWFVFDTMWEVKNGIFDTIYQIMTFSLLIKKHKPDVLEIWGKFDFPIKHILASLSEKHNFKLESKNYRLKPQPKSEFNKLSSRLSFIVRLPLLKLASALSKSSECTIAIFQKHGTSSRKKEVNNVQIVYDHYLEGFEQYMIKNRNKILFISHNMPRLSNNFLKDLINEFFRIIKGEYKPWLCYYSFFDLLEFKKEIGYYQKKVLVLEKEPDFKKSMLLDGIDIYPFLKDIFRKNFPRILSYVKLNLKSSKRFLEQENPSVVFTTDGITPVGRTLCYTCNQNNVKIYTLQGGIISPQIPVNIGFFITEGFDVRLLPNLFVWGPFYDKLVRSRGYPSALIKKGGFWKNEESELKTSSQNYLLYLAVSNLNKLGYLHSFDEDIFTIKQIHDLIPKNLKLLVKVHPHVPIHIYSKSLKNLNRIILVGGENAPDVKRFIKDSIVVIGKDSTALIQALILDKPVIVCNFASGLDFIEIPDLPFVTTPEAFKENLLNLLNGKSLPRPNLTNYCDPLGKKSVLQITDELESELKTQT